MAAMVILWLAELVHHQEVMGSISDTTNFSYITVCSMFVQFNNTLK